MTATLLRAMIVCFINLDIVTGTHVTFPYKMLIHMSKLLGRKGTGVCATNILIEGQCP